jgi:hypothetical protein
MYLALGHDKVYAFEDDAILVRELHMQVLDFKHL